MEKIKYLRKIFVYLDYNVIIGIKNKEYSESIINFFLNHKSIHLPYTPIHIAEINNIKEIDKSKKIVNIYNHLEYLSFLTKNNYYQYYKGINRFEYATVDPIDIYKDYYDKYHQSLIIISFWVHSITSSLKNMFRNSLDLSPKELNNINPKNIFEEINKIIEKKTGDNIFLEVINRILSENKNLIDRCFILFELLNTFGYWKDKNKTKLDISRIYDAIHTGYATYSELFITSDHKTKMKALAVYNFLKLDIDVISPQEAPDKIKDLLNKKNKIKN